jgi:hypothetical protein
VEHDPLTAVRSPYRTPNASEWVLTCAAVLAFIAMRLWRLTAVSLDGDEIFSLLLARSKWGDLLNGVVSDAIHPPLFYVLLKIWVWVGGESLLWLRLFPVVASALSLIPLFYLCRDLKVPAGARNLAIAICAVHPYALFYAQHVRMYCLLMLFGMFSTWRFERYLQTPSARNLVALTLANLFLVYSHYFGWLIVGFELVYLLWRRLQVIPFLGSSLLTAVLFSPWALVAIRSLQAKGGLVENLGWVPRPVIGDMIWFYVDLTGFAEFPAIGAWTMLSVLIFLVLIYRERNAGLHWLIFLCLAPAPLVFAVTLFLPQSIWGHRHLVFTMWPFLVVFTDALWRQRQAVRVAVMALAGVWAVFAAATHAVDDRKLPWDTLTLAMLDEERSGLDRIPFYSLDPYLHYPVWFYLDCLKNGWLGPFGSRLEGRSDIPALAALAGKIDTIKNTSLDAVQGSYFWIGYSDSSWKEARTPRQILEQRGCQVGKELTARDRFHRVVLFPVQCALPNRER